MNDEVIFLLHTSGRSSGIRGSCSWLRALKPILSSFGCNPSEK